MLICKHTIETKATPTQIWKVWEDVENWKKWDPSIETSEINGPFRSGTEGFTKFIGTPRFKTVLTEVELPRLVVQEAHLFLAKVVSYQRMDQNDDKTQVTFEVEIRGPLALFFFYKLRRFIKKKIPLEMEEMLKRAV